MPWVSEEQIQAARNMTAIEYLRKYQGYRLRKSSARNEWELTDHDSFKINEVTSKWHWKSRDIGGISALNFLVKVDGIEFTEAVQLLCEENPSYIPQEISMQKNSYRPFVLPDKYPDCKRVQNYLSRRGISNQVISYCIQNQILYESSPYHNAVFVGMDEKGTPRYAFLRGIYDKAGKVFRMEQAGSEKQYAFCIPPTKPSVRVAVYEAGIDAMAHMTLEAGKASKYRKALGGISVPQEAKSGGVGKRPMALEQFLKAHPEVKEIELCLDNDTAGRRACQFLMQQYEHDYKVVVNLPYIEGADYGDLALMEMKKIHSLSREKGIGR